MIFQATLSNKNHLEYGVATIPFPIPADQYDHTIELLESMGIGAATAQDCQVGGISGSHPSLNRLVTQSVNVDELDYLAKRLDSFCDDEWYQFEAMAYKLRLSDIKELINLTFCCQQATMVTDFSNLEQVGKAHSLTINGGSMPTKEYDKVDGHAVALDLIQSGSGVVTPFGVVYDNGMELEQLYDGHHLPEYYYEPCMANNNTANRCHNIKTSFEIRSPERAIPLGGLSKPHLSKSPATLLPPHAIPGLLSLPEVPRSGSSSVPAGSSF